MKDIRNKILETFQDDTFLFADGFDEAIIGICTDCNNPTRVVYSITKCIDVLIKDGMSEEDATEHFYFNVSGGYVGEQTPVWVHDEIIND